MSSWSSFFFRVVFSVSIFGLIRIPTSSSITNEFYSKCSNQFVCGDKFSVGYPFWGDNRPYGCGIPGLNLQCESGLVKMDIENVTYQVREINPQTGDLTISREDFLQGICTPKFVNTTLDPTLFDNVAGYSNLTFVYGCSSAPIIGPGLFTCVVNGAAYDTGYILPGDNGPRGCYGSVYVPVPLTTLVKIGNMSVLQEDLKNGFQVQLKVDDTACEVCMRSSGVCGYDFGSNHSTCYCQNQSSALDSCTGMSPTPAASPTIPGKRSPSKVPLAVGLALGGVGIVGILLGWWFFATMRRRKMEPVMALTKDPSTPSLSSKEQTVTTTTYSQTIPSYPTSKSDIDRGSTYFGVQVFNHEDLEEATDNFDRSKELGDGGFGAVYYGVLGDGRAVAVKRLYENNMKRAEQFMNEIEILARLRHKNLVVLYGCTSRHGRELLLVYEYIPNGTVADHLHGSRSESGKLTWPVRFSIAIETAGALAYLHCSDVIHRDVKTNNILLDNNFSVKVADFGLSRLFPNDVTHVSTAPQGTPGYVDPEYYQCYHLTDKSDVYSFGVVLIELISSLQAVDTSRGRNDINLANMAVNKIQNQTLSEIVDPYLGFDKDHITRMMVTSVAALAFRCLQPERDMRPTMEEVLGTLRRIKNENYGSMRAEVVDFSGEDVRLLKHVPATFSPDSVANEKWVDMPHTY